MGNALRHMCIRVVLEPSRGRRKLANVEALSSLLAAQKSQKYANKSVKGNLGDVATAQVLATMLYTTRYKEARRNVATTNIPQSTMALRQRRNYWKVHPATPNQLRDTALYHQ